MIIIVWNRAGGLPGCGLRLRRQRETYEALTDPGQTGREAKSDAGSDRLGGIYGELVYHPRQPPLSHVARPKRPERAWQKTYI